MQRKDTDFYQLSFYLTQGAVGEGTKVELVEDGRVLKAFTSWREKIQTWNSKEFKHSFQGLYTT